MKKRKRRKKSIQFRRMKKKLRESMRLRKVLTGLQSDMTLTDIHRITGMAQQTIRKVMMKHPEEITFAMLKRQINNKEKKR